MIWTISPDETSEWKGVSKCSLEIYRSMPWRKSKVRTARTVSNIILYHDVLQYSLSVKHAYNAVAVTGIVFGVGYHDDGCTLFVQVG